MKKHDNPLGHVVFHHEYSVLDGNLSESIVVMTAHLSQFPWLEVYLEFDLSTPRKKVRKDLVKELQDKIILFRDFICSECDVVMPTTKAITTTSDNSLMDSFSYVVTEFGALADDTRPAALAKGSDDVLFKPLFSFTDTNREVIKPLFKKWFKERKDN